MNKKIYVGIIGLGQMGGSLGLALKSKAMKDRYHIIGIARKEETLKQALKIKAVDEASLALRDAKLCDIAVICTPVDTIVPIYRQLSKIVGKNTIITDAGSVKEQIERQIEKWRVKSEDTAKTKSVNSTLHTPLSTLVFIPAHPMAGRENNGIMSADGEMFKNANIIITGNKNPAAEKKVAQMWKDAGAKIVKMTAKKHDDLAALTSHLPHIIAFSLNKIYKEKKKNNSEIDALTAGSFKSMTRVSVSSADMWAPIFAMNGKNIKKHLKAFIKKLKVFEKALNSQSQLKKEILKTQE
ncbi:MAG: prephenate dehydrogenase/arogenate dehydrogenase family protein [Endomicrobia bacterium]|nr:prephenate dehydrogenase/arogenate dehydrogenase family protein [Endomicrobiia bacterium]